MNRWIPLSIVAASLMAPALMAQTQTFTVGKEGRDARQLATVESVTDFETFTGRTAKVRGSLTFDPAKRTGGGTLIVDMASVDTGIPLRNEHMQSGQWMDTAKFPEARFVAQRVQPLGGDRYRVTGNFTMRGVTRPLTVTAQVQYRPESDATRRAGFEGNVLRVATTFRVKLSDYGIKISGPAQGKVANDVAISLTVFATTK